MKNKKGLSEVLGYVLLIVISLSLATLVFVWMNGLIFKGEKKCPDSTSLIIEDCKYDESIKKLTLCLRNKGFFNISGFYARYAENRDDVAVLPLIVKRKKGEGGYGYMNFDKPLKPNEKKEIEFTFTGNKIAKIEIEPFRIQKDVEVLCYEAIINQEPKCSSQNEYKCN